MEKLTERRISYIDGLKGAACVMIMCFHYLSLYRMAEAFSPSIFWIDNLTRSVFNFLIDQGFWLYLFFVVSGFLISQNSILRFVDVLKKCLLRFLRLALPILAVSILTFLCGRFPGFHNSETSRAFTNSWFQSFYSVPIGIKDIILAPISVLFMGNAAIDAPYWVLNRMMYASFLIYLLNYLCQILPVWLKTAIPFCIALRLCNREPIISACLFGMLCTMVPNYKSRKRAMGIASCVFLLLCVFLRRKITAFSNLPTMLFFSSLLIFFGESRKISSLLSSAPMIKLGKLSWGIYSFHWPVICSAGSLLLLKHFETWSLPLAYGASCFFSVILTFGVSSLYSISLEKLIGRFLSYIRHILLHRQPS